MYGITTELAAKIIPLASMAYDISLDKLKIGNGIDSFANLPYIGEHATTQDVTDNSTKTATTEFVHLVATALADVIAQNKGNYAAENHNHGGVYQPAGSYSLSNHNHDLVYLGISATAKDSEKLGTIAAEKYLRKDIEQKVSEIVTFAKSPKVPTPISADEAATKQYVDNSKIGSSARQCAQSGSIDANGQANFITAAGSGLSVNITATSENITLNAAGGAPHNDRIGVIVADTTLSGLTPNAINYIYADITANGTVQLGFTTLAPNYIQGGTPSITANQFTFLIGKMKGYLGNGSAAIQAFRVFLAEAATNASAVTSVTTYAINGYYDSNFINTLPSTSTLTSKNHNIGVTPNIAKLSIKCISADLGYAVGDTLTDLTTATSNGGSSSTLSQKVIATICTNKTIAFATGDSTNFCLLHKTSFTQNTITNANWAYRLTASRGW